MSHLSRLTVDVVGKRSLSDCGNKNCLFERQRGVNIIKCRLSACHKNCKNWSLNPSTIMVLLTRRTTRFTEGESRCLNDAGVG
jgi:hypothetical protein